MTTLTDTAIIDIAGNESTPARRITGTYQDFSDKRLILTTRERITSNAAVFVSARDFVFLGEVGKCSEIGDEYTVEIAVRQTIARM